jgi:hypothetical protein
MKPFDLEAAKRGEKLVTREGKEVTEFHHFKTVSGSYPCTAVVNGERSAYTLAGHFNRSQHPHCDDLFMAAKKRTVYVQIFNKSGDASVPGLKAFAFDSSADAADNIGSTQWPVIGTFPIEIEVD